MVFKIFRFIAETAILHVAFTLQDPRLQSLSKYFQIELKGFMFGTFICFETENPKSFCLEIVQ